MSSASNLIQKIFEVTRGDLEKARLPSPDPIAIVENMSLLRLRKIERFWNGPQRKNDRTLERAIEELIIGWYGQGLPFFFSLVGNVNEIQCWYGAPRITGHDSSHELMIRSAFPGVVINKKEGLDRRAIERLSSAVIITGVPDGAGTTSASDGIGGFEKVIRGLVGTNWMYGVYAEPVQAVETIRLLNETSQEITEVYSTYLLKGSPADENNQLAQRYVDLLEAKQRRLEYARTSGLWAGHSMLLTEGESALSSAKGLLYSAFSGEHSRPEPLRVLPCFPTQGQTPVFEPLTSRELAVLVRPPNEEYPGYRVTDHVRFSVDVAELSDSSAERISVGTIQDRGVATANSFDIKLGELAKHVLVAGVTGSGKTNTCFLLLERLWAQGKGIPFLVIEPVKSEYRCLLNSSKFPNAKVFTVGDERISPLRLNPLAVPEGILVQTHIDLIKALFAATFVLYPPMPYVLEQSLHEVYEDKGWDIARNVNGRGKESNRIYPMLADLADKVRIVVDRMGYDERITMDVKAGLLARINQLCSGGGKGIMLNTRSTIDFRALLSVPCVLELKQVASDDEKAFLIGLFLVLIYEHNEVMGASHDQELRHVTLIEEAHRLLRNTTTDKGNEVHANPRGQAIETFANILSEIRTYGEGFIVAEQIPTKLTTDVIKNTNIKLIHRIVDKDDRETVGAAMNMGVSQVKALGTLRTGEAVVFSENLDAPALIRVSLSHLKNRTEVLSDKGVQALMKRFWKNNDNLLWPYSSCGSCSESLRSIRACREGEYGEIDRITRSAFVKLFNVIRLNKVLIWDAYEEFYSACKGRTEKQKHLPYCTAVGLTSQLVERRGKFYGWLHDDVQEIMESVCSVLYKLSTGIGNMPKNDIIKNIAKDLISLSNRLEILHKVYEKPYVGCQYCDAPCLYRFDMSVPEVEGLEDEFRNRFLDESLPFEDITNFCLSISNQVFFSSDVRARRGAALCWGIQQLAGLGLSNKNQKEMTVQLLRGVSEHRKLR